MYCKSLRRWKRWLFLLTSTKHLRPCESEQAAWSGSQQHCEASGTPNFRRWRDLGNARPLADGEKMVAPYRSFSGKIGNSTLPSA